MIVPTKSTKYKGDLHYGNLTNPKILSKKDMLIKQKPAAPEIKKKAISPLTNIHPSYSDSNMFSFSNVSSVKSFARPKSMERLKRKQNIGAKRKQCKSKPKKKTKRNKNDFSTFDHNGSLVITKANGDYRKQFGNGRSADARAKVSTSSKNRRQKLDNEIQKLCKTKLIKDNKNSLQTSYYQCDKIFGK